MEVSERVSSMVRRLRERCRVTPGDVAAATGLTVNAVLALEHARSVNLPARHVYAVSLYFRVHVLDMLLGRRRQPPWTIQYDGGDAFADAIRLAIRKRREAKGVSSLLLTEWVSEESKPIHQSWISRLETGEVRLVDLKRAERIAVALDTTLLDLVTTP